MCDHKIYLTQVHLKIHIYNTYIYIYIHIIYMLYSCLSVQGLAKSDTEGFKALTQGP